MGGSSTSPDNRSRRLSVEEIELLASQGEPLRRWEADFLKAETAYAHLEGTKSHYRHKTIWSLFLVGCVAGMLVYQMWFLWAVGTDRLDFTEYDWLLPTFLVQSFGQIVGLAVYAVRSLFRDITGQK